MYTIGKILIENFKLFDHIETDLSASKLLILSGPNGFGKTTFFDAIELVITGKIFRIEQNKVSDERFTIRDYLLQKKKNKDILIKVEFKDDKSSASFTIVKHLKHTSLKEGKSRQWHLFDTYIISKFEDNIKDIPTVEQFTIEEKFKEDKLERIYNLYYYIQQEESAFFLKKTERERVKSLEKLFDIEKESSDLSKFRSLRDDLTRRTRQIDDQLKHLSKTNNNTNSKIKFVKLFPEIPYLLWDQEDMYIDNLETKNKYISEIDNVDYFLKNSKHYYNKLENDSLKKVIHNRTFLSDLIRGAFFLKDFESISLNYSRSVFILNLQSKLQQKELMDINFNDVVSITGVSLDVIEITHKIERIKREKQKASEMAKLLLEINHVRKDLVDQYIQFTKVHNHESECPLCGFDWNTIKDFQAAFSNRRNLLESFYDSSIKDVALLEDQVVAEDLKVLNIFINTFIDSNVKSSLDNEIISQLNRSNEVKDSINRFIQFCKNKKINIDELLIKDIKDVTTDIDSRVNQLITKLEILYLDVNMQLDFERLQNTYQHFFDFNPEKVKNYTHQMLMQKVMYVEQAYFSSNGEKIKMLSDLKSKLIENSKVLVELIKIYETSISKHREKICTDIQIPFYIYSGKLIQNHQRGLGLFITGGDLIRFTPSPDTDNDAINILSSGQISALIISFTLALNKIYARNDLDILLIDDPVQTMDDINMVSFVELLRNDFSQKQIILSTHEESISRYIGYKFSKYNLESKSINVKDIVHKS